MFNEELIKERRQMVIQQLIYDKISCLCIEKENEKDVKVRVSMERDIKQLESICDNIDAVNVTLMSENDKEIIIKLLEDRINDLESGREEKKYNDSDPMDRLVNFIIYEYKLLLKEFLLSIVSDDRPDIKKNSN